MSDITVIKCGGSIIDGISDRFFKNIVKMQEDGKRPIIVHGGGPAVKSMLEKLDVPFSFINGLRTTSEAAMDVVEMVLTGHVNNTITRQMNAAGIQAAGFSGSDVNLMTCEAKDFGTYGYVGDIVDVNMDFLTSMLDQNIVPVIAPIAVDQSSNSYNVNADTAAAVMAQAACADKLIFVTDVPGVIKDGELLQTATETDIKELIKQGTIHGGMVPKVEAALACLNDNLHQVMIANANQSIGETGFKGTMIRRQEEAV